jgi:endonuclease YncB( thermonuclease family)
MVISQNANCFDDTVTEVVDGETLDVNNVRIKLALIDAPEKNETGYSEARHFVESLCK